MGDMYEMDGGMGGYGMMSPYIQNYAPQVSNFMTQNPYMGKYVEDIVDDLRDMGMGAGMGMQGGLQGLIQQGMSMFSGQGGNGGYNPYMMYGDGMGEMKDLMKDLYKMQNAAQYMSGYGRSSGSSSSGSSAGSANPSYTPSMKLQKRRLRRPSRLLHPSHKLQKPREFPWYMLQQFGRQLGQGNQNFGNMMGGLAGMFGYDGMDAEDRAMAIAMGVNPRNLPPPTDGVDVEDMWMYPQYNRRAGASTSTGTTSSTSTDATADSSSTSTETSSTNTGSTGTQANYNMGYYNYMNMWPWWSSLQKRHMKY